MMTRRERQRSEAEMSQRGETHDEGCPVKRHGQPLEVRCRWHCRMTMADEQTRPLWTAESRKPSRPQSDRTLRLGKVLQPGSVLRAEECE